MSNTHERSQYNQVIAFCEAIIFNVRWMLIPFYFGLIVALGIYTFSYGIEIYHLLFTAISLPSKMILVILELNNNFGAFL